MAYVATYCLFLLLWHRRVDVGLVRRWNFWFFGRRGAQMRVATKNVSKKLQLVTKLVKSSQTKELLKSSPE
jgi:hypothetical protein